MPPAEDRQLQQIHEAVEDLWRELEERAADPDFQGQRERILAAADRPHKAFNPRVEETIRRVLHGAPFYEGARGVRTGVREGAAGSLAGEDDLPSLTDLPVLTKRLLNRYFAELIVRDPETGEIAADGLSLARTSGSTGQTTTTLQNEQGNAFADSALMERLYQDLGLPERGICFNLGLHHAQTPLLEASCPVRDLVTFNLRAYRPDPDRDLEYSLVVRHFDPVLIIGATTRLVALARWCRQRAVKIRPQAVVASYEQMTPAMRATLETAFACPVTSMYGTAEVGPAAWECPAGLLHFEEDFVLMEVLDGEGRPVRGRAGSIVLSSLKSDVMPILRYDSGDLGERADGCTCRRAGLPALKAIEGRAAAQLYTRGGYAFSPYALVSQISATGIDDFQLVQQSRGVAELRVGTGTVFGKQAAERFTDLVAGHYGDDFRIEVRVTDDFDEAPSGKRNPVVQRLSASGGP